MPGNTRIVSIYNTQRSGNFSFEGNGGDPSVLVRPKSSVDLDLLEVQLDDTFIDSMLPFVSGGQIEVRLEGVLLTYQQVVDLKYIATVGGGELLQTQDEGNPVVFSTRKMSFEGAGVTATQDPVDPNKARVAIPGETPLVTEDEGSVVVPDTELLDFLGPGVTAVQDGGNPKRAKITIPGRIAIVSEDEGVSVVTDTQILNFVGPGVTATQDGGNPNRVIITIPSAAPPADHFVVVSGRNAVVTNIYLAVGGVPSNLAGFVLPYDATIIALSAATTANETWVGEVRKNNAAAVIASISMTAQSKKYEAKSVNVNQGDELQMYCNGSGISRPVFCVFLKRR
jgi:hypothetical protein